MKCDRCSQPSVVAWVHPIAGGRLEMCVRHSRKRRDALVRQGWLKVARVAAEVSEHERMTRRHTRRSVDDLRARMLKADERHRSALDLRERWERFKRRHRLS